MKQTFLHGWKQIALLLVFPLMAEGAGAQERITLGECYEWAHANYPQIRQYGLIEQTERYNLSNAAKGWMPQLSVNAKATYQSDVRSCRSMPISCRRSSPESRSRHLARISIRSWPK